MTAVFYFIILFAGNFGEPVVSGAFLDRGICEAARAHVEAEGATTSECYAVAKELRIQ